MAEVAGYVDRARRTYGNWRLALAMGAALRAAMRGFGESTQLAPVAQGTDPGEVTETSAPEKVPADPDPVVVGEDWIIDTDWDPYAHRQPSLMCMDTADSRHFAPGESPEFQVGDKGVVLVLPKF